MKKSINQLNKAELLTETKRVQALLDKENGFLLIWAGLTKILNEFKKEWPLLIKDLQLYGKESKAFFLEIREELKL